MAKLAMDWSGVAGSLESVGWNGGFVGLVFLTFTSKSKKGRSRSCQK